MGQQVVAAKKKTKKRFGFFGRLDGGAIVERMQLAGATVVWWGAELARGEIMSKASMAKRLVELGDKRAFNTLRKLEADVLRAMVADLEGLAVRAEASLTKPELDMSLTPEECGLPVGIDRRVTVPDDEVIVRQAMVLYGPKPVASPVAAPASWLALVAMAILPFRIVLSAIGVGA
jgi:hypothetical protein